MKLLGVFLIVATVYADEDVDGFLKEVVQFLDECGSKSLSLCFKERVLTYIDELPTDIEVGSMFTVMQTEDNKTGRHFSSVALPDEPRAREEVLDSILAEKIYGYLASHTFQFKIPTDSIKELRGSFENEARKKKGKKKGMPFLLLFQLKAAIIGAILLKLIGLVAFKALVVAKIALTIISVIGLRKLLGSKHHSSTYEVVAQPYYSEDQVHDRSFGQQIA